MKWMKQAARNLVAMAAALCLLLPCAVPASAESLQTPVWMQAWGGTRTAGVVGQLEQDRFTATIRVGEMNGTVELVRDNGKMYWKAEKLDGTEVLCLLVRDGSAYQLDHSRKLAIRLGDESAAYSMIGISEEAVEKSLATGKAAGFANAKKTVNGKTYYYEQNTTDPVTGIRSIDNKLYYFDANGVQQNATFGIDVSKYQSSINFEQAKQAGVEFVIIRIGYRGYGSGTLVQDPKFEEHFTNARNAGLRVGVYCFTQAVNENEAREEAQACVYVLNGRQLDYPIYFDTEASGSGSGRADGLGVEDRTKCAVAFCEEIKALGYQPGVYASTTWFRKRLDMSRLTQYNIWNAHYNVASSPIACNMWQGSCTARIPGYGGQIDVNISYMG